MSKAKEASGGGGSDRKTADTVLDLANKMDKSIKELQGGLRRCEKFYEGPAGLGYKLKISKPGGEPQDFIYLNGAKSDVQLDPKVGGPLPSGVASSMKEYRIISYKKFRQHAASVALDDLAETKKSANKLDKLTKDDPDDLVELVRTLAHSIDSLGRLADRLQDGSNSLDDLIAEASRTKEDSWWTSGTRGAYTTAVTGQKGMFNNKYDATEKVISGAIAICENVTGLVRALKNLAHSRSARLLGVIDDILEISEISDVKDLSKLLLRKTREWDKQHVDDTNEGLKKLTDAAGWKNAVESAKSATARDWTDPMVDDDGHRRPAHA